MAQRVRKEDLFDGIIDNSKIENLAVQVGKVRTLDTGDSTGINAETLPFGHSTATPTIADKINAMTGINWIVDKWVGNASDTQFYLQFWVDLNSPHFLFVNGQFQNEGVELPSPTLDYYYVQPPVTQPYLVMNYVVETGLLIEFRYQKG